MVFLMEKDKKSGTSTNILIIPLTNSSYRNFCKALHNNEARLMDLQLLQFPCSYTRILYLLGL